MSASANIARFLPLMAAEHPSLAALKLPRGRTSAGRINYLTLSFSELEAEVSEWHLRFSRAGIHTDDRVLVMVRQGLPLIAAAFALFRLGAVPIIIDPGMGLKNFLNCVRRSQPHALVGIPAARIVSHLFGRTFRSVRIRVAASGDPLARLPATLAPSEAKPSPVARSTSDLAAILFTSGSTGAPKGVCYEHGMFEAQIRLIRTTYNIQPGEVDLPMLPIFALFNPALGMTTIIPEINPSRPASVDPAKIVQAIRQENVTNSFGSPTLWNKISTYCIQTGTTLPSLRRVLCAGAPVPAELWKNSSQFLVNGLLHSPYGATEALPVSSISAPEITSSSVHGACVGKVINEMDARIIALTDEAIHSLSDAPSLPTGEIGEIIVRGPTVTRHYDALPEATAAAKITDDSSIWHRMGDCGYRDADDRLWFCGRKAERVIGHDTIWFTEPCEQVFRPHPIVARCALIGLGLRGQQTPALIVQPHRELSRAEQLASAKELRTLARQHPHTAPITRFYFHPDFPVDVRHNAKIHRLTLALWAARHPARELHVDA